MLQGNGNRLDPEVFRKPSLQPRHFQCRFSRDTTLDGGYRHQDGALQRTYTHPTHLETLDPNICDVDVNKGACVDLSDADTASFVHLDSIASAASPSVAPPTTEVRFKLHSLPKCQPFHEPHCYTLLTLTLPLSHSLTLSITLSQSLSLNHSLSLSLPSLFNLSQHRTRTCVSHTQVPWIPTSATLAPTKVPMLT